MAARRPIGCECGRQLGEFEGTLLRLGPALPYWGEIEQPQMLLALQMAQREGWRHAVRCCFPPSLHAYVEQSERGAFMDLMPWPPGSRILEVGSGLGAISAGLAREYCVFALEGVEERARFVDLRAHQDGLSHLLSVRAALPRSSLAPKQFDGIVLNGVLEWVGVWQPEIPPRRAQLDFLISMRRLLRSGGAIYLAIENRFGWPELRGSIDHSGLRYTSLMPRFLARWIVAGNSFLYRSRQNVGYRTYTYSYYGYQRLFRAAGLRCRETWLCPSGYNNPQEILPLQQDVIRYALRRHNLHRGAPWRQWLKRQLGREWLWRLFGADFLFLLESADA